MKALADICVVPLGADLSLSKYVAACEKVFDDADLTTKLHAFGTNVQGDVDQVFEAIKRCHQVVHDMGAPRIMTKITLSTRTDRDQTLQDKIDSVTKVQ